MSQSQINQQARSKSVALYVLLAAVAILVIYLFYAVIHPEQF